MIPGETLLNDHTIRAVREGRWVFVYVNNVLLLREHNPRPYINELRVYLVMRIGGSGKTNVGTFTDLGRNTFFTLNNAADPIAKNCRKPVYRIPIVAVANTHSPRYSPQRLDREHWL